MASITLSPTNGVTQKFDVAFIANTSLPINSTNFPWYTSAAIVNIVAKSANRQGYTVKQLTGVSALTQFIAVEPGKTPNVYELNIKGPVTLDTGQFYVLGSTSGLTPLATLTNLQAVGSSTTAISVSANSVAGADGYRLFSAASQAATYTRLGGILPSPSFSHTGLSAGITQWYKWQAVGDGVTSGDSALTAAFSGTAVTSYFYPAAAGDSLLTPYPNSEPSSIDLTDVALDDARFAKIQNVSVPGARLSAISSQLDTLINNKPSELNNWIILLEGGINDLDGVSASPNAVLAGIIDNVNKLYAAGARKIIVSTITAFNPPTYTQDRIDDVNSRRSTCNARILSSEVRSLPGVVAIVNPGQDVFMGSDTAGTNATYYLSDGVHYATGGRQRMAQVFYAPAFQRVSTGETGFIINGQALTTPSAPTQPLTNDAANTFDWTNNGGFSASEYTLDGGINYLKLSTKPLSLGEVAYPIGKVGVRVGAGAANTVSSTLFNQIAFTNNSVPSEIILKNTDTPPLDYPAGRIDSQPPSQPFTGTLGDIIYREPWNGNRMRIDFFRDGAAAQVDVLVDGIIVGHYSCEGSAGPANDFIIVTVPSGTHNGFTLVRVVASGNYQYFVKATLYAI